MSSVEVLPLIRVTASPPLDALIFIAVAAVAAGLVDLFVTRIASRIVSTTSSQFDDRLVAHLHRPVFVTVFLFGVSLALRTLEAGGVYFSVIQTILVVVWAAALLRITGVLFEYLPGAIPGDSSAGQYLGTLLRNVTVVVVIVGGAMGVLSVWGISITPLLASAGLAGVAVALAAKDTIANFFGGISILADRPYGVGHYIILESGERGEVADIGLRSTRIKTRDDILITVPNSIMANSKIINESAPVKRFRIRIPIGVAYGTDVKKVEAILLDVAAGHPGVEDDPEPRVRFRAFADSSLNFELLCWAGDPMDKGKITHELNVAVYERFNLKGVSIPFPQRDVHLYRAEG